MLTTFLLLLKANWKWVAVGIAVALLLGYLKVLHLEVSHYKTKAASVQLAFDTYRNAAVAMHEALKSSNEALTLQFKETLVAKNKVTEEKSIEIQKRIKSEKELRAILLPNVAVELFNAGKAAPQPAVEEPAAAKQGDERAGNPAPTLADLLFTVKVNEMYHDKCVDALTTWQEFWRKFVDNVKQVEAAGSS